MKTLFITSFHPHISRNILATNVLEFFKQQKDLRVVIIAPFYKRDYFEQKFCGGNVIFEGVEPYQASKTKRGLVFKKIALYIFNTDTAKIRKRYEYYVGRKRLQYFFALTVEFIGKFHIAKVIVRYLDYIISPKGFFLPLIKKYQPDLIFLTDIQNENDVSLVYDARRDGVPTLGMIRSWDNVTQRLIRVFPDRLLVGSEILKDEVIELYGYSKERIVVCGNPHYDRYLLGPSKTKEEFFAHFGFDLGKRLILYAPISDDQIRHNDVDQYVMEELKKPKPRF